MKIDWLKAGMYIILVLSGIQFVKETFALIIMKNIGVNIVGKEVWLGMIGDYYLVMIVLTLSIGFLLLIRKIKSPQKQEKT